MTDRSLLRRVVEGPRGFSIEPQGGDFVTTDRVLAESVARQFDRDDPLPCPEHGDFIDLVAFGKHPEDCDAICGRCYRIVPASERTD